MYKPSSQAFYMVSSVDTDIFSDFIGIVSNSCTNGDTLRLVYKCWLFLRKNRASSSSLALFTSRAHSPSRSRDGLIPWCFVCRHPR
jgi:hypothetical protein